MSFSLRLLLNTANRITVIMMKICLTILILFSSLLAKAQRAHLNFTGDAKEVDGRFYSIDLVSDANQTGGAWYPQSFNLDSSFFVDVAIDFKGLGAEGFAIVLHSDSIPVGPGAEQLGVPNTENSFIIEFDLQQNASTTDGAVPHSSFFKNGALMHQGGDLLQDGTLSQGLYTNESIRIDWDAQSQRFTIKRFGCTNSDLNYIGDIKNTIFEGNPKVFLGYTAATSAVSDTVRLRLHYNSEGISEDKSICQGEEVQLHAYNSVPTYWSSNEPYTISVSQDEFMLNSVEFQILAKPINSGYYKVSNLGFCGYNDDSIWVEVVDTLSLSTEVTTIEGENTVDIALTIEGGESPYSIEWILPDLSTSSNQDLIDVPFGVYQVTVTNKNLCSSNLEINLIPEPIVQPEPEPEPEINVYDGLSNTDPVITDGQLGLINYGNTQVGNSITKTFAIENTGTSNLIISSISVTGTDFFVSHEITSIVPGVIASFAVTLPGINSGVFSDSIRILSDDLDEADFAFAITGEFTELEPEPEENNDPSVSTQDYFSPNSDGEGDLIRINVQGQSQIVDFQGRILRTVNHGDLWDGTSDNGKLLSSGVYIVVGEQGKQVITLLR